MGCGKGADINKFNYERISGYVGMDISMGQLIDALNRRVKSQFRFPTLFIKEKGQANPEVFAKHLPKDFKFNIISAQFCIHYFFDCEDSVRNFLMNISSNLSKNGLFFATFPDSKVIAKKFLTSAKKTPEGLRYIGNDYYSVITSIRNFGKLKTAFGNKYGFFLEDGLIGSVRRSEETVTRMHIPEYLILSDYFIELAKEYDLEVVLDQNFHTFYAENIHDYVDLFKKIGFNRNKGERLMDDSLWECSYLYKILMLRKTSGERIRKHSRERFQRDSYWEIKNDYDDLYSSDEGIN